MKRSLFFLLCYTTVLSPASLITITEPGTYQIGNNITYNSTSPGDTIIAINTSDVVLDLNNKVLTQGNPPVTMLAGIAVGSNVSNIKIKNGTINSISGIGVFAESGTQGTFIDNIITNSCTTGFSFQGAQLVLVNNCASFFATTGNAFQVNGSQFVNLTNIFTYSTRSDSILLEGAENCRIKDAVIAKGTGNGISITTQSDLISLENVATISCTTNGINMSAATNCNVTNFAILNCASTGNSAIAITNSNFLNVIGCKLLQNGNNSSNLNAINISGCNQSLFQDIMISSSITTGMNAFHLDITNQLIFRNCNIISSFANGLVGFFLNSRNTTSCVFEDCSISNCVSFPGGLTGFLFGSTSSPNNIVIKNCNVLNNLSGPNLGGYSVSASAAAYYYFEDCNAKNNASTADTSNVFNFNNLTNLVIRNSSIVNSTLGTTNGGAQGFKGIELINSTLGCVDNLVVSNISAPTTAVVGVDFGATISCHMTDCNITNCLSQGSGTPATGFQVRAGALYNNLIRCVSNNHYATSGGASGFSFTTTTSCSAQDCQAYRNNAAGGSVGFSISASTFYTFIRNSASGHPNNNFSGFNANNFDVPSDSVFDTNFSCTPWTNFGING